MFRHYRWQLVAEKYYTSCTKANKRKAFHSNKLKLAKSTKPTNFTRPRCLLTAGINNVGSFQANKVASISLKLPARFHWHMGAK